MLYITFLVIVNFCFFYSQAQDDELEIKNIVNHLFISMKSSDKEGILASFHEGAILKSVLKDSTGLSKIEDEMISDFAISVSKLPTGYADERISFDIIKIDGELAFVWAPYELYINGKFKHCGVDVFILTKLKNVWKITSLIDTRRKIGCKQQG